MESTPIPSIQLQFQQPLSIKDFPRKLPIKRKTPNSSSSHNPNPTHSPLILTAKLESPTTTPGHGGDEDDLSRPPPFKFHRIWTEPDEIRFLQGLLNCSSESLSFPRDLNIFYNRFSNTVSQPYTKSQLYEKLRRLRKKFRVIAARLAKGLDKSLLSPHDRDLFELSKQLWHPDYSSTSPFGGSGTNSKLPLKKSKLVGVKVSFSPSIPLSNQTVIHESNDDFVNINDVDFNYDDGCHDDVKLSEVNVEFEEEDCVGEEEEELQKPSDDSGNQIGRVVAETVIDVFDQSLKEAKMGIMFPQGEGKDRSFEKRWRELRAAEMEALGQRLRLVIEDSL